MFKSKKTESDTFWMVLVRYYSETDDNGNEVQHKKFYAMPYVYHNGDEDIYDTNKIFDTENEANEYALTLTQKEGY